MRGRESSLRLRLNANDAARSRLAAELSCRSRTLEAVSQPQSHDAKTRVFVSLLVDGFSLFVQGRATQGPRHA